MPRERFNIRTFTKGMIPSVDTTDIERDAAFWCRDVDMATREGQLIGVPADELKTVTIGAVGNAQGSEWIEKTDGKRTLVYHDAADNYVKYIEDFYGTPGAITNIEQPSGTFYYVSIVRRHQSLRYNIYSGGTGRGTPTWVGYTDSIPFGAVAITTPHKEVQECKMYASASTNGYFSVGSCAVGSVDTNGYFTAGRHYYYRFAIEYDGYQISILDTIALVENTNYVDTTVNAYSSLTLSLRAYGGATSPTAINRRITAIHVFRAESSASVTSPTTSYRFVTRVTLADAGWLVASTHHKDITITDTGYEGDTFEALSGLAETATGSILDWNVACAADNYMFIGNCVNTSIDDAEYMIFRSVLGRFDVYDFQSSAPPFLKLPIKPKAMAYFFGKLLVFDNNNTIIINPETLAVEQIIEGYGCLHPQSLYVTETGVYFADQNGINFFNAKNITRITSPIFEYATSVTYNVGGGDVTISDHSYRTLVGAVDTTTNRIRLSYHARFNMLIVSGTLSGATVVYGYYIDRNAWTLLTVPNSAAGVAHGWIVGKDGELYIGYRISTTNSFYKVMSDFSARKLWVWISQRLSFAGNGDDEYQKIYYLYTVDSGTNTKYYGINDGTISTSASGSAISAGNRRNTSFRFLLACGAAGRYINNVSIIYRLMAGMR